MEADAAALGTRSESIPQENPFSIFAKFYLEQILTTPLVCPKCGELPLITISKDTPLQLNLYCFCSYEYYIGLLKFFQVEWIDKATLMDFKSKGKSLSNEKDLQELQTQRLVIFENCLKMWEELIETGKLFELFKIKLNPKCHDHPEKNVEYFCTECASHVCKECFEANHSDHISQDLSKLIDMKEMEKIFEIFKDVKMMRIVKNVNLFKKMDDAINQKLVMEIVSKGSKQNIEKLSIEKANLAEDVKLSGRIIDCTSMLVTLCRKLHSIMGEPTNYVVIKNLKELTHLCIDNINPKVYTFLNTVDEILKGSYAVSDYLLTHMLLQHEEDPDFFKKYELLSGQIPLHIKTIKVDKSQKYGNHVVKINCMLILQNGNIVLGTSHPTIKVINKNSLKCEMKYKGHTAAVNSLININDKYILSCSDDNTIIKWENKTAMIKLEFMLKLSSKLAEKVVLNEHKGPVIKLVKNTNKKFVSCSKDKTIIIWEDAKTPRKMGTMVQNSNSNFISMIMLPDDILATVSDDNVLLFWDILTYKKLTISVPGVECYSVNSLQILNTKILLVGGKKGVTLIDYKKAIIRQKIESDDLINISSFLIVSKASFLTGGKNFFCQYDFKINEAKLILKVPSSHTDTVTCLENKDNFHFTSAGHDSMIKTWMFDFEELAYSEKAK